jgi:hypothetical protein
LLIIRKAVDSDPKTPQGLLMFVVAPRRLLLSASPN